MPDPGESFVKGGCGCLIAFAVLGFLAVIMGGRVHIDPCGAVALFVVGGGIGLIVMWIYNKGASEGQHRDYEPRSDDDDFPGFGDQN